MLSFSSRSAYSLHLVLLLGLCTILYFPYLGKIPFFNKGEPREALVVQEMVQHGNWLFPLKRGEEIPSKPPLFHWFAAMASMAWRQVTEMTVRFPSALFATLCVLLLYWTGRRLFNPHIALLAGFILATTGGYQSEAVTARVDMTLTFFVTLLLIMFFLVYQGILHGSGWLYAFYLLAGVGLLAKGPVGLLLPGMVIFCFLAIRKRWDFMSRLCFHRGMVVTLLIGISWYGLALLKGGDEFFSRQVIHENLARFFVYGEGGSGHQKPFYYYFPYLMLEGLPWSLFLPFVVVDWFKTKSYAQDPSLFLMLWAGLIFFFFSISAGKRSVYILPLYVPLSLLTGMWLEQVQGNRTREAGLRAVGWFSLLIGLMIFVPVVVFMAGKDLSWLLSYMEVMMRPEDQASLSIVQDVLNRAGWFFQPLLFLSSLLWVITAVSLFARKHRRAAGCLVILSLLLGMAVQGAVMPSIAESRSYQPFMAEVNRRVVRGGSLAIYGEGWDYNSVIFYRGERLRVFEGAALTGQERVPGAASYYIMSEREWRKIAARESQAFSLELRSRGTGPDGKDPIVLIRTMKNGKGK